MQQYPEEYHLEYEKYKPLSIHIPEIVRYYYSREKKHVGYDKDGNEYRYLIDFHNYRYQQISEEVLKKNDKYIYAMSRVAYRFNIDGEKKYTKDHYGLYVIDLTGKYDDLLFNPTKELKK